MVDEILGRTTTTKSAKEHAWAVIKNKDLYTKDDVKEAIDMVLDDKRLSEKTKSELYGRLKVIYKRK